MRYVKVTMTIKLLFIRKYIYISGMSGNKNMIKYYNIIITKRSVYI